jgi:hypothetical protein
MGLFADVTTDMMEFGGGAEWYPKGTYEVTIEQVHIQDLPSSPEGLPYNGYVTTEGEQLSIQFGNFTAINGAESPPGNNKMFLKLVLSDGDLMVFDVPPRDDLYVELAKSKRRLAAIADALGVDNVTPDEFVSNLRSGKYDGCVMGSNWALWRRGDKHGAYPSKFTSIVPDIG